MRRYTKIVKEADRNGLSPQEICRKLGYNPDDWGHVWAAARIYVEDGGRRYSAQEFIDACGAETPEIVRGHYSAFASWDASEWDR